MSDGIHVNTETLNNERRWIKCISGVRDEIDSLRFHVITHDIDSAESSMRAIASAFAKHLNGSNASYLQVQALEWFEYESPRYDIEEGDVYMWMSEVDYRLSHLYNWADYNRCLIT